MKKICILSSHFFPIKSSSYSLIRDLVKKLLSLKYQITLVTLSGSNTGYREINLKNFNYFRETAKEIKSTNNYRRAISEIFSILKLLFKIKKEKYYDYLLVYSPSIFWAFLIPFLKKRNTFLILRDLYPKWLVDNKILKKYNISYYFLKFVENLLYRQCDKIFVQTRKDLKYLKKFKNNKTKLFTLENWVTEKKYNENNKLKQKKYIRFLFIGVIGIAQDYNKLLEMIEYCEYKNYNTFFYFVGSGSKKKELILKTKKFKNVFFFNSQDQNKLDKIILKCHICLSTLNNKFKSDNFPGKILRYMLFNKPILVHAPGNDYLNKLIKNNKLGLFSSTDDQLRKNLDIIFCEKNFLNKYGNNGVALIKDKFSTINAIKKLFKI